MSTEFIIAAWSKSTGWGDRAAYMASHGMTMIAPLLGAALLIEAAGSACLVTGYRARPAAAIMFVYLGIVSVRLHDFWNLSAARAGMSQTEFFKNLGMMGGLLRMVRLG